MNCLHTWGSRYSNCALMLRGKEETTKWNQLNINATDINPGVTISTPDQHHVPLSPDQCCESGACVAAAEILTEACRSSTLHTQVRWSCGGVGWGGNLLPPGSVSPSQQSLALGQIQQAAPLQRGCVWMCAAASPGVPQWQLGLPPTSTGSAGSLLTGRAATGADG